jgi:hypothetical protein
MGYTHYWVYSPDKAGTNNARKNFKKVSALVAEAYTTIKRKPDSHSGQHGNAYADKDCIICGGFGEEKPIINESEIWFNGEAASDTDHETFHLMWWSSTGCDNSFCKTARKPYDLLVCFTLMALDCCFADAEVFRYSSDGDEHDWHHARRFFKEVACIDPGSFNI